MGIVVGFLHLHRSALAQRKSATNRA